MLHSSYLAQKYNNKGLIYFTLTSVNERKVMNELLHCIQLAQYFK